MNVLVTALVGLQSALSLVLLAHALVQLSLARGFARGGATPPPIPDRSLPSVTVQLPVYNERYVVERLISSVARLCYPRDRLEVQVLDDSTDETAAIVEREVRRQRQAGLDIVQLRRSHRGGYKAGALANGLVTAKGELIALFDADFVPEREFLARTTGYFADPRVGLVQTRWGHANAGRSLLTRVEAFLLDTHFTLEQGGRSALGCFINFNGSAGIWRAATIHDAGGWSSGTLTEDLDLSYRAQLRGWRFVYLNEVHAGSDLPEDVRALRVQQFRWMKGVAQNAVEHTGPIARARLPLGVKVHAVAHLCESGMFVVTLLVPALTAALALFAAAGAVGAWVAAPPIFLMAAALLLLVHLVPRRQHVGGAAELGRYLATWCAFFVVAMGLSVNNSLAVASGLRRRGGTFVRTPKALGTGDAYVMRGLDRATAAEAAVWLYLLVALALGARAGALPLLSLPALAFVGLSYVLTLSLGSALASRRAAGIAASDRIPSRDGRGSRSLP